LAVTFFTDEDVSGIAVREARKRGVSIVTVQDVGLRTEKDDLQVFRYAIAQKYVMVSGNVADFPDLLCILAEEGTDHCGLFLISPNVRENIGLIVKQLVIWSEIIETIEETRNDVYWIRG
jgi:predicted nuclease of predicted toxin-antitoxin system